VIGFTKKLLLTFISIVFVLFLCINIFSETMTVYYDYTQAEFTPVNLLINGEEFEYDAPIPVLNGTAYAPVKAVFEKAGANVYWVPDKDMVVVERDDIKIEFTVDSNVSLVNGIETDSGCAPKVMRFSGISGFYTMVPLRFTAETLGMFVGNNTYT
jgi:hypothetical protein